MKKCNSWMGVVGVWAAMMVAGSAWAGSLDPINPPGPTMKTLQEIYDKQDATHQLVAGFVSPQTLSDTTTVVNTGYYAATNLTVVDTDLVAANIKTNVTIFGVVGTLSTNAGGGTYSAAVPKTGQTTTYATGDDGDLEKGVALPSPRFTDNANGTVTDNLTGLIWLKNANFKGATRTWAQALTDCATLNSGEGGLTDGSVEGAWRLPNVKELQSLIDFGNDDPALPAGHSFTGVVSVRYWSSSTYVNFTTYAWTVYLFDGFSGADLKTISTTYYVWPIRGGQ